VTSLPEVICSNPFFATANPPHFGKFPSQKSKPVRLEKGRAYPILAVKTNEHMSSGISVAWTLPGKESPEIIATPHLSVTADGRQPGVTRRIWSDVAKLADLKKRPDFPGGEIRDSGGVLHFDGTTHVELPRDVTQLRAMTIHCRFRWTGQAGEMLFECPGSDGARMAFSPNANGKSLFVITANGRTCEVAAAPVPRNTWSDLRITLSAGKATLVMDARQPVSRPCQITPLDVNATCILLGRSLKGNSFHGSIESFSVSHPSD
jgi:hypothetical protein